MKIITPQVNQTGEVRLLSKLLNQKVDTVRCMCSRGKTLTVQGLWVCKKTGSLVEMHLQALELLTFRYAYKTVLNQSKQKKKGEKKGWSSAVSMDAHIHTFIHSFTIHVKSLPPTPTLLLDPLCLLERERRHQRKNKKKKGERSLWANAQILSDLHLELIIKQTFFDRFLTSLKNVFWTHLNRADGQSKTGKDWTMIQLTVLFYHFPVILYKQQYHLMIISWKMRKVVFELEYFCHSQHRLIIIIIIITLWS